MERNVYGRVSQLITDYSTASESFGEMLPKTPEELALAHEQGLSYVLLEDERPIAHAALWPLINIQGIRLYEFGSWITDPEFRHHRMNGMTAGELAAFNLIQQVDLNLVGVIATIKRFNTKKGLEKLGAQTISFHKFPFITGLTCSCVVSEYNHSSCQQRRRPEYGEIIVSSPEGTIYQHDDGFTLPTKSGPPKLPCTLMGFYLPTLKRIETQLGQLFVNVFGHPLCNNGLIDRSTMDQLKVFYQQIGVSL